VEDGTSNCCIFPGTIPTAAATAIPTTAATTPSIASIFTQGAKRGGLNIALSKLGGLFSGGGREIPKFKPQSTDWYQRKGLEGMKSKADILVDNLKKTKSSGEKDMTILNMLMGFRPELEEFGGLKGFRDILMKGDLSFF
jgi:hypothetical protein